jgi:hypothetical protein
VYKNKRAARVAPPTTHHHHPLLGVDLCVLLVTTRKNTGPLHFKLNIIRPIFSSVAKLLAK